MLPVKNISKQTEAWQAVEQEEASQHWQDTENQENLETEKTY